MPSDRTRRDVLKWSLCGLTSAIGGKSLAALPQSPAASPEPSEIKVFVTSGNRRFAPADPVRWRPRREGAVPIVALNPGLQFQEILGFGAAFTEASCYNLIHLSPSSLDQLLRELFAPSEMALGVCRICMGSSDYSTGPYSYDDGDPDPELARFSIARDRDYILPVLRQARSINPDLFLFASPWSPPGWMKSGASLLGGSMRPKYLAAYAQYFLKFLQAYAAEGVSIQAVTPQNEVDTDQDGRMPACIWPQESEIRFVRDYLGPLLKQNRQSTAIWILDHNYDLWGRATCELDDPDLRQFAAGLAWHGYSGTPEMMSRVHQLHPGVPMHWTEGGSDYTDPAYLTDWVKWGQTFTAVLHNWCRSITAWNLALDQQGRPNIGPFNCGGVITIHSQSKEIVRSGLYWTLAHFSRCIRRGARRFDSQCPLPEVSHAAFINPDGQNVLILTNSGPARPVIVQTPLAAADVLLPQDSMTTLVWY